MSSRSGLREPIPAPAGVGDPAMVFAGLDDAAVTAIVEAGLRRLGATLTDVAVDDAAVVAGTLGLQRLENLAHAWKLRGLAEVRERQAYRAASARSTEEWLSRHGYTRGEALAQVAASQVLVALPGSAALAYQGRMTMPQLQTAARSLGRLPDLADAAVRNRHDAERDSAPEPDDGDRPDGDGHDGDGHDGDRPDGPDGFGGLDVDGPPGPDEWRDELDRARRDLDALVAEQARRGADRGKLGRELDRFEHDRGGNAVSDRDRSGRARRRAWFATIEGMRRLTVELPLVDGQRVEQQLRAAARRDGPPGTAGDQRRPEQRLADAALRLLTQPPPWADTDGPADPDDVDAAMAALPGPAAQVLVITTAAALAGDADAPAATIDGIGPIAPATLAQACCDATIAEIMLDGDGTPLHAGRSRRTANDRQRRAVLARDRVCVGCGAPAWRCQIHHVHWYQHGGRTDVCNLCLLCWDCHHNVHHNGWITYRLPTGRYDVRPPNRPPPAGGAAVDPRTPRRRR